MAGVSVRARAKLNLTLHVGAVQSDGYHPLDSYVAFADFGDEVAACPAEGLSLAIDGPFADALAGGPLETNLALRAARALEETARTLGRAPGGGARGADIRLTKNLPIASGVGGGSADAAAVLWALNTLWDLRLPSGELEALGFTLGADLPMCVRGAPARALGAGERLSPAPAPPPVPILLVNPLVETPTGPIFRAFDAALEAGEAASSPALEGWPASFDGVHAFAEFLGRGRNDLQAPAIALQPVVGDVLAALERSGAVLARMSGSGATCFGLFGAADAALAAQDAIQSAEPGWWTQVARLDAASAIAPHIRQHSEEGP